jgi:Protein of unknown function (DUF4239)
MPDLFYRIYDLSITQLAVLCAVIFVGFSWFGAIFIRPVLRAMVRTGDGSNDVVGYIVSCFCVFYGLLLGLIAVAAYQNLGTVEQDVNREAASLGALHQDVSTYPAPHGQNLRWLLSDYTRFVIKYSWPAYREGRLIEGENARINTFHERLLAFKPQDRTEEIVHAETLRQFNTFLEHHRVRENDITTGIPPVMWYVVLVGAFLNIMLVWLFDMRLFAHLIRGGILAFFLGAMILLIAAMDNPYRGEVSVSPKTFEDLYWKTMRN